MFGKFGVLTLNTAAEANDADVYAELARRKRVQEVGRSEGRTESERKI